MNKILQFALLIVLVFVPLWIIYNRKTNAAHQNQDTARLLVQAPLELPEIQQLRHDLWPAINEIFKQELGYEQDPKFPIFFFKGRHAITVYYIDELHNSGEPREGLFHLFIKPALDSLAAIPAADITIPPKFDFFGELQPGLYSTVELVALIEDSHGLLSNLNKSMKQAMHRANDEYKRAYHTDLYNIPKSERFPYVSHLSLGHLRINYLKYLINNPAQEDAIIARIKQKIIAVIQQAIESLPQETRTIEIEKIAIFDLEQRKYVEEVMLHHKDGVQASV